ncbi:MAG TPA: hypothetical protein VI199_00765 [Novosphingobium sp.]
MADEYETSRDGRGGTTVIHETRTGSGAGWVVALVLVLALVAGVWYLAQANRSQSARDSAITHAARQVGNAAESAGNAAQDAANQTQR